MKILNCSPLQETELKRIQEAFPEYEFIFSDRSASQEFINEADIIIGNPSVERNLNLEKIQAILLDSAGSDAYVKSGVLHPNTKLTNASGSYGKAIGEQVIGMLIALCKNIKTYSIQMSEHNWNKLGTGKEIYGSRVCIVGYGDIGHQIAKRLKPFGCYITAVKRRVGGELPFVDEVHSIDELDAILPENDIVILSLPQNAATMHLFDREKLLRMKKDAILVNVGRGIAVVTDDLVGVMKEGHLYGAALDVVDPEPLPAESGIWDVENILLTPHSSGGFVWQSVRDYYADLVIRNIRHLAAGEELENEVDATTGYRKKVTYQG